ncbi:glycosyltransferase [Alteromonas confluentis]|uniref:Glycosyl transferase n=1 Tax=Alteromonas confluentis TaxID=1656094 RepID=A0A1E7Z945_9ALTE|nr:glycosyltransferase [Alteromonas confluentis]OFC69924.1 hypothetical protein BFC18_15835 [Alteromonas confluentis]
MKKDNAVKSNHRVLFLHKAFSLDGGVERVHKNLSSALAQQGVSSIFYVNDVSDCQADGYESLAKDFSAFRADYHAKQTKKIRYLFNLIKSESVTVIISATETANMLAFFCKLRFPALKVIFTRHCAFDVSDQKLSPWAIKALYTLYSLANGSVVAVSDQLREEIAKSVLVGKRRVDFIPNAVLQPVIGTLADDAPSIPLPEKYFCSVGRLVEQKGFDLLIKAYHKALDLRPSLPDLVIVGEGEDRCELESLASRLNIKHKVHLPGFNSNPYSIVKRAEIFILSSRHEGMPTVLVESIFLNTPVIAFDCPTGPRELVTSEEVGALIPAENIDRLADAIAQYDELLINDLSISEYVKNFSYENVAKAYISKFC